MIRALRAMVDLWRDRRLRGLVVSAVVTVGVGTVFYAWAEGWSVVDALYFSVMTLTTVGFGDLTPSTTWTRLFTVVYVMTGVAFIGGFLSAVSRRAADRALRSDADPDE